jgi:DNA repair protein RadC
MRIREWPVGERPRERLLAIGPHALSDAELLAVIVGSGTHGRTAVDIARTILAKFGSVRDFLLAERRICLEQIGIGPVRLAVLQAALELARRHQLSELRSGPVLPTLQVVKTFLLAQLRDRGYEVFCCIYLNAKYRLLAFEELFRGTVDYATVHPREVARQALLHNSVAVIVAHNHPSGIAEPSNADKILTRQLQDALAVLGVKLLDHIIVGGGRCTSLSERGLIQK